jgi:hypothetical protein
MKHHNPLFPYVYRFGTLIFDWLPYRRYRRETMSNATGGPPTVDISVRVAMARRTGSGTARVRKFGLGAFDGS